MVLWDSSSVHCYTQYFCPGQVTCLCYSSWTVHCCKHYAHIHVTPQGGEEGQTQGIMTAILHQNPYSREKYHVTIPRMENSIFYHFYCQGGWVGVIHPQGEWVGTKVLARTPTPGGFSWSDLPGSLLYTLFLFGIVHCCVHYCAWDSPLLHTLFLHGTDHY